MSVTKKELLAYLQKAGFSRETLAGRDREELAEMIFFLECKRQEQTRLNRGQTYVPDCGTRIIS